MSKQLAVASYSQKVLCLQSIWVERTNKEATQPLFNKKSDSTTKNIPVLLCLSHNSLCSLAWPSWSKNSRGRCTFANGSPSHNKDLRVRFVALALPNFPSENFLKSPCWIQSPHILMKKLKWWRLFGRSLPGLRFARNWQRIQQPFHGSFVIRQAHSSLSQLSRSVDTLIKLIDSTPKFMKWSCYIQFSEIPPSSHLGPTTKGTNPVSVFSNKALPSILYPCPSYHSPMRLRLPFPSNSALTPFVWDVALSFQSPNITAL